MSTRGDERLAEPTGDERLLSGSGIRLALEGFVTRIRGGDLGALPVVLGIAVIWTVFQLLNPVFLSSENLVNLTMQCAAIGTIALGVVLVLLVGEIDLSVGSVSGLAAAVLAVSFVQLQWNLVLALAAAIAVGCLVGLLYGYLFTRFGVPSFVITLAGLLGFLGLQLWVLGETGSIAIPFDSWLVQFAQQMFLPAWASYVVAVLAAAAFAWSLLRRARRRAAANLVSQSYTEIGVRSGVLLAFLLVATWYLNIYRGVGVMFLFFLGLIVAMNFVLTRTRWGRAVYAVGGSVEAARRAGIRVDRIYLSVFAMCSTLAAVGGILAAARLGVGEPELRHGRREPQRDRRGGHRRGEPVRRARIGVLGARRHRRDPVDLVGPDPHEPGLVGAVHDHRRRARARGDRRLALTPHTRRHRSRLNAVRRRAGFTWRTLGRCALSSPDS